MASKNRGVQRYRRLQYTVLIAAIIILGRLFYVQLVDDRYKAMAAANIMRMDIEYPMRGEVLDRRGEYLIRNRVCYDVMVVTRDIPKEGFDSVRLAKILNISMDKLRRELRRAGPNSRAPHLVVGYLSQEAKLIFDESEDEEPIIEDEPVADDEPVVAEPEVEVQPEVAEPIVEEEKFTAHHTPHTTSKQSAILSLYEENPTPIIGEQFQERPSLGDTIVCPKGVAESAPIASLHSAIGLADKFLLIHELFGGDSEAYDRTINALDSQPSFDDCVIYIAENFTWSPNSEGTKLIMELLQRKYNA